MTIHLPKDLESRVEAAVESGHFASVHDAMAEAVRLLLRGIERTRPTTGANDYKSAALGSIGAMRDASDELDEIVAEAYQRRNVPWREVAGE